LIGKEVYISAERLTNFFGNRFAEVIQSLTLSLEKSLEIFVHGCLDGIVRLGLEKLIKLPGNKGRVLDPLGRMVG
jgi:hypothetical protein